MKATGVYRFPGRPRLILAVTLAALPLWGAAPVFTRGPFLQDATTNSIKIAWRTAAPASSFVEFGPGTGLGAVVTNSALVTEHLVLLTDLAADMAYSYQAGSENTDGTRRPEAASFHTLKTSGAIRFLVVGDTPAKTVAVPSPDSALVAAAMRKETTDLVLHCGDLVYNMMSNVDVEFFSIFQPQMRSVPFYLVAGNHDLDGITPTSLAFQQTFYLPTNSATGTEEFYSFDHGDVHFVGLYNPWFQAYVFTQGNTQYNWLTNDLAQSAKPWKVIFLHFPIATSAVHSTDNYNGGPPDHVEMMNLLAPVAQRYGVQMIFGCHDHDYERFVPTNGVHHLVTGGGGRAIYTVTQQHPASAQFWPVYEYVRASVSNETMLVEAVNTNGVVFDSISITRAAPPPRVWQASWNTPVIETSPANDGDGNINGQRFDFTGAPIPALTGQFSNLGRVYVNNDGTNLYVGFQEAAFYRGHNIFLFIESPRRAGVSTMAGLGNGIIDPAGQGADGLDCLENLSFANFAPAIGCILGDEYADGQFRSFVRSNLSLNIGQGVFYLDQELSDVPGTRLQQYNRSPQTNSYPLADMGVNTEQNADFIEVGIPFAALGQVQPGDILRLGAVVAGTGCDPQAQTRQLDTGFLGNSLTGSGQGPMVLEGLQVQLADPLSRLPIRLAQLDAASFRLTWPAVVGQVYQIEYAEDAAGPFQPFVAPGLPLTAGATVESFDLDLSQMSPTPSALFFRVRTGP